MQYEVIIWYIWCPKSQEIEPSTPINHGSLAIPLPSAAGTLAYAFSSRGTQSCCPSAPEFRIHKTTATFWLKCSAIFFEQNIGEHVFFPLAQASYYLRWGHCLYKMEIIHGVPFPSFPRLPNRKPWTWSFHKTNGRGKRTSTQGPMKYSKGLRNDTVTNTRVTSKT